MSIRLGIPVGLCLCPFDVGVRRPQHGSANQNRLSDLPHSRLARTVDAYLTHRAACHNMSVLSTRVATMTAGVVQRKKRRWEAITAPHMLHVDYTKEHQRWSVVTSG